MRNLLLSGSNMAEQSVVGIIRVKPKLYQREGQPHKTENYFLSITCCAIKGKEIR